MFHVNHSSEIAGELLADAEIGEDRAEQLFYVHRPDNPAKRIARKPEVFSPKLKPTASGKCSLEQLLAP
jgi:hypothetical protein